MSTYHHILKKYLFDRVSLFTTSREYSLNIHEQSKINWSEFDSNSNFSGTFGKNFSLTKNEENSSDCTLEPYSKNESTRSLASSLTDFQDSFAHNVTSNSQFVDSVETSIILPESSENSSASCYSYKSVNSTTSKTSKTSTRKFTIENLQLYLNDVSSHNLESSSIYHLATDLEHELGPLSNLIHNYSIKLTGAAFVHWFSDAISGMAYLHDQLKIVHFTINSKNLYLRNTKFGIVCELANFGVDNEQVGEDYSVRYLAPELLVSDFQYYRA